MEQKFGKFVLTKHRQMDRTNKNLIIGFGELPLHFPLPNLPAIQYFKAIYHYNTNSGICIGIGPIPAFLVVS